MDDLVTKGLSRVIEKDTDSRKIDIIVKYAPTWCCTGAKLHIHSFSKNPTLKIHPLVTQTDGRADVQLDGQKDRQTDGLTGIRTRTERRTDKQKEDIQTKLKTDRRTNLKTDIQSDRLKQLQADRQTHKTDILTERQTNVKNIYLQTNFKTDNYTDVQFSDKIIELSLIGQKLWTVKSIQKFKAKQRFLTNVISFCQGDYFYQAVTSFVQKLSKKLSFFNDQRRF
jgi:hypothetical protein